MSGAVKILFCRCAYFDVLDRSVVGEALARLRADPRVQDEPNRNPCLPAGAVELYVTEDLCGLAARKDPLLGELAGAAGLTVVACFPRAVRSLFAAAGAKLPDSARVVNMRGASVEEIVREALGGEDAGSAAAPRGSGGLEHRPSRRGDLQPPSEDGGLSPQGEWKPWFPVIDPDRCVNCRQCLNFCLFGVYAADEDGCVRVVKPAACKTFCPACARICPSAAIIFPKFADGPINGDEVTEEHLRNQKVQLNPSALTGGDVHAALRRRSATQGTSGPYPPLPGGATPVGMSPHNVMAELRIPPEVVEAVRKELAGGPASDSPRRKAGVDTPKDGLPVRNADVPPESPAEQEADQER